MFVLPHSTWPHQHVGMQSRVRVLVARLDSHGATPFALRRLTPSGVSAQVAYLYGGRVGARGSRGLQMLETSSQPERLAWLAQGVPSLDGFGVTDQDPLRWFRA